MRERRRRREEERGGMHEEDGRSKWTSSLEQIETCVDGSNCMEVGEREGL